MKDVTKDSVLKELKEYCAKNRRREVLRYVAEACKSKEVREAISKEVMEALALSRGEGGIPGSGHISDKTFFIAANYQEITEKMTSETLAGINKEFLPLNEKLSRMEFCVNQLSSKKATVIQGLYFKGKSIKALAAELSVCERTIERRRDSAVDDLVEMYEILHKAGVNLE